MTAPTAKSFLLATGVAALVLIVVGATGALTAAWGYGLLLLSAVGLVAGLGALSLFVFTDRFDGDALLAAARWAGGLGGFLYGTGAGALRGELQVRGARKDFGTIDRSYWNTWIVRYRMFRVRVRAAGPGTEWSPWLDLEARP